MHFSSNQPIGIFDSGVGGTSIWKEVKNLLPNENIIYLADSKNAPYGPKGKDEIINLSIKNTELLLSLNCKLIIVACNTATTNAIETLRKNYSIPFIGIEPAIKPASLLTKTNKIGILATRGTLNSILFEKTSNSLHQDVQIIEQIGEGLVPLIEKGMIDAPETNHLLLKYINPMLEENIDALVLGCTHYPYLIPQIQKIVGENILIVDSGQAVARQTKNILIKHKLISIESTEGKHQFFTNSSVTALEQLIQCDKNCEIKELDF